MMIEPGWLKRASALATLAALLSACTPGYIKASKLEDQGQGPTACAASCADLKMRMVAMVLVGDTVPGCVCQVLEVQGAAPQAAPVAPAGEAAPAVEPPSGGLSPADAGRDGAAASSAGYVVIAAAAAAQRQQEQQRRQQQQQKK